MPARLFLKRQERANPSSPEARVRALGSLRVSKTAGVTSNKRYYTDAHQSLIWSQAACFQAAWNQFILLARGGASCMYKARLVASTGRLGEG